jgi:hypothetical protein
MFVGSQIKVFIIILSVCSVFCYFLLLIQETLCIVAHCLRHSPNSDSWVSGNFMFSFCSMLGLIFRSLTLGIAWLCNYYSVPKNFSVLFQRLKSVLFSRGALVALGVKTFFAVESDMLSHHSKQLVTDPVPLKMF